MEAQLVPNSENTINNNENKNNEATSDLLLTITG